MFEKGYRSLVRQILRIRNGSLKHCWYRVYLDERDDAKALEVDKFLSVLELQWGFVFAGATRALELRRPAKLRKPSELQLESDVICVRNYIQSNFSAIMTDTFMHWSGYQFISFDRLSSSTV